jgi:hypothetical protein
MYVNPLLTVFAYAITPKDFGSKLSLNIIQLSKYPSLWSRIFNGSLTRWY